MSANLVMIRDSDFGMIILTNEEEEPATFLLSAKILEHILKDKSYDIYSIEKKYRNNSLQERKGASINKTQINNTTPSLKLESYIGVYYDRMYGDIQLVGGADGDLVISFSHTPVFSGHLKHWHYDTFLIDWYDIRVPDGFLTFNFNAKHEIMGFKIEQENLLDVDFEELNILRKEN